ncbi:DHH family phosphoesterase [Paucibacter sp. Y2R2-4]|uniref:DHH family phosphoesterase n=1 Tax=Paucibacter sp. Y2R2-4 TaxID=2893553 RepID=UPI0021E39044|nr:DHHA1 domain-containing protein [Paucibacter sp. Y2R2-4]MCV2348704.1 phosphoesterase [Paucibacter sp. Y2R2-4]
MKSILPLQLLIAPSKTDPQPLVLYHGKGCSDGFAAALAAWIYYEGKAEFIGLDHGQVQSVADLPALAGRAVYILDFSFPQEILSAIEEAGVAKLVLLDHHKSAAEKLSGYACRCGVLHFDMSKSGARLAWEFFHSEGEVPALVRYIEDRDIWAWQYPESGAFLSALDMEEKDFVRWQALAAFTPEQLTAFMARGAAMDEKYRKLCADLAEGAQPLVFNGIEGLMVNAPGMFHSLVGDLLSAKSGTFALMWSAGQGGAVKCGLRSQRHFDCIALAESMGGGGHAQACGFRMGVERLPALLSGRFEAQAPSEA